MWKIHFAFYLAILFINNILIANGATCSSFTTQSTCNANSLCTWITKTTSYCACASVAPQDVIFIMDSSGSMGSSNWALEKSFVSSMITTGVSNSSRIGVVQFDTATYARYNLTNTQYPRSVIATAVNNLGYPGQSTFMKNAVQCAIDVYKLQANKGYNRLALMTTDGVPNPATNQDPCGLKATLDAQNITLIIVGVGSGFTTSAVECLVDDPTNQIITVSSFTSFDLVRTYTDNYLCPSTIQIVLTEVRVNTSTGSDCKFVEFYNLGSTINFVANKITLTGYVSGTLNSSVTSSNWTAGGYLVLYKSGTTPKCSLCTCTDANTDYKCDAALYIACSGTYCTVNTNYNSKTATNTNWGQTALDSDGSTLTSATYGSGFPTISTGYTSELQSTSYDESIGSNWAMSCTVYGTPGDAPVKVCTSCVASTCQASGDTGASCNTAADVCNCTETGGYYKSGSTCIKILDPPSCTATIKKDDYYGLHYVYIEWVDPSITATHYFQVQYPYNYVNTTAVTTTGVRFYTYYDETVTKSSNPPKVQTVVPDNTSLLTLYGVNVVTSGWTTCPLSTSAPTHAPTQPPTKGIPIVPSCNATVSGYTTLVIKWKKATTNYPITDATVGTYKIYLTCNGVENKYYSTSQTRTVAISSPCGVGSNAALNLTSIRVVAVVNDSSGNENDVLMRQYSTSCTLYTPSPTNAPVPVPTQKPVSTPSKPPTSSPTYEPWKVTACVVTINPKSQSISVSYVEDAPTDTSNPRTIYLKDYKTGDSNQLLSSPSTVVISGVTVSDTSRFYVYPEFLSSPTGSYIGFSCCGVVCSVHSSAPSPAPTKGPSVEPTPAPTGNPSKVPTTAPTVPPTPAPTYLDISIDTCIYYLEGGNANMRITFNEPDYFDPTGFTTPTVDQATYKVVWSNGAGVSYLSAIAAKGSYDTVVSTAPNFDTQYGVTVTVYYQQSKSAGPAVTCSRVTVNPTAAPSPAPTTPTPTFPNPQIKFDLTGQSCTYDEDSNPSTAYCTFETSNDAQTVKVDRSPNPFFWDVQFSWNIAFTDTVRRLQFASETDFVGAIAGSPFIVGNQNQAEQHQGAVSFVLPSGDGVSKTGLTFWIVLTECHVNDTDYEVFVQKYSLTYACSLANPYKIFGTIADSGDNLETKTNSYLPTWIWIAIAGALIFIPLLTFFGYRYYKKRKFAEQMQESKKQELKEAENQDDAGNFGGVGDDVRFNPLATGGTHDIATGGQLIDRRLEAQKGQNEVAQVDVDQTVFRQDFGQVQGVRRK